MSDTDLCMVMGLEISITNTFIMCYMEEEAKKKKKKRRRSPQPYVRPMNTPVARERFGHWANLLKTLELEDDLAFHNYTRMMPGLFNEILFTIRPYLTKTQTNWKDPLDAGLKLASVMRYMATGDLFSTLATSFRCGRSSISNYLPDVCAAITVTYKDQVCQTPSSVEEWKEKALKFERRWNFPHCCGALDGKHIAIRKPPNSGSDYINYKGFFSIVLMALVDADYKFIWVDMGGYGRNSDGQIFNHSDLAHKLQTDTLGLPPPEPLRHDDGENPMPYFIVGDDAFGLKPYLMKPHGTRENTWQTRIANYRISRARRVVENAFGILANRYRCFLTTMLLSPDNVRAVLGAAICLHNLHRLRKLGQDGAAAAVEREDERLHHVNDDYQLADGAWRQEVQELLPRDKLKPQKADLSEGVKVRKYLTAYFNSSAGSVPWQDDRIRGGKYV